MYVNNNGCLVDHSFDDSVDLFNLKCLAGFVLFFPKLMTCIIKPWLFLGVSNHLSTAGRTSRFMELFCRVSISFESIKRRIGSCFPFLPGRTMS